MIQRSEGVTGVRDARRNVLLGALALMAVASVVFYYRQNSGGVLGGAISPEKTLWLAYTLIAWFVLPAFLVTDRTLPWVLRRVFVAHLASMSVRATIELVMLYSTVSWSPLYGIAHDLFNVALVLGLAVAGRRGLSGLARPRERAARFFVWIVAIGILVDAAFAALFHMAVSAEGEPRYFAGTSEEFAFINLLTLVVLVPAYTHLFVLTRRVLQP